MKIVSFKDGTYGIRKGYFFFGYKYYDLVSGSDYWWPFKGSYWNDCKGDLAKAEKRLQECKDRKIESSDYGTPV